MRVGFFSCSLSVAPVPATRKLVRGGAGGRGRGWWWEWGGRVGGGEVSGWRGSGREEDE